MSKETIPASDEAWDGRLLGADENFVKAVGADIAEKIDEAVGSQLISIRMQKSTIEDLKLIASLNRIGYQTLMKQVMQRFVECEKKQILRDLISEKLSVKVDQLANDDKPHLPKQQPKQPRRKAA